MNLIISVDAGVGETVMDVIKDMLELAEELDCYVETTFNGYNLFITKNTNPYEKAAEFNTWCKGG